MSTVFAEASQRNAVLAATRYANDPANAAKLSEDVRQATAKMRGLQEKFVNIGVKLLEFDNRKDSELPAEEAEENRPPPPRPKFFPRWDGLSTRFRGLANNSYDAASTIGTYFKSFDSILLLYVLDKGGVVLPKEEKLRMLQSYVENANNQIPAATALATLYNVFVGDLASFATDFFAYVVRLSPLAQKAIAAITSRIQSLLIDIHSVNETIDYFAISFDLELFVTKGVLSFFPQFGNGTLIAGASAVGNSAGVLRPLVELSAAKSVEIKNLNAEKAEVRSSAARWETIEPTVLAISIVNDTEIHGVAPYFVNIRLFWEQILGEVHHIIGFIETGENPSALVSVYLETSKTVYAPLGNALINYASGISSFAAAETVTRTQKALPVWANINPSVRQAVRKLADESGPQFQL